MPSEAPMSMSNGASRSHSEKKVPPLGMTGQEFLDAGMSVINDIDSYYSKIESRAVVPSVSPGYLRNLLPASPPQTGEQWASIEGDIERVIMPGITHWQHPKFMAFYPANATYPSMLGEMWSAALTAPAFNWICSPVVTELETIVLDWLAQILALPPSFHSPNSGGGVIQGSASEAVVTVMVAARERYIRRQLARQDISDPDELEDRACMLRAQLVALGSEQAHSSTKKGAAIAGTRYRELPVHSRDAYTLTPDTLRSHLAALKARGLHPYYLTVSLGTTNTAAVDNLALLRPVLAENPDLWIHCDAAYAGAALALPQYHHLSRQLTMCDSFNVNMHKWLLVNFDASCLYVQSKRDLTDALTVTPAYLRNQFSDSGVVTDYRDWQIPLGRRFRALKIWFVLRTWGVQGLQAHVQRHLDMGDVFAGSIRSRSDLFSLLVEPQFAVTVFTVRPRRRHQSSGPLTPDTASTNGADPRPDPDRHVPVTSTVGRGEEELAEANAVTKEVFEIIDARREFFLTSSIIGGVFAVRVVSANPLAEVKFLQELFGLLVEAAEGVLTRRAGEN